MMLQLSNKAIGTIKITFNAIFIGIIIYRFLQSALKLLPSNWLFFITSDAVENFVFTTIVYVLYFKVIKSKPFWYKTSMVIFFIVSISLLASLKTYRITNEITFERTFDYFTAFLGTVFLFYVLVYLVNRLEYFSRYKQIEIELDQVKKQLLRNQLQPHFLFNAFNSLYSMALNNNPKTADTILKLSSMMRYLTDDSIKRKVKLIHELKFIEEYLAIEKVRFGEQAKIHMEVEGEFESKTIEPLLLMVLVENAFKHGFYTNNVNAFVSIQIKVMGSVLYFTVENSLSEKQHFNATNRKGKGLENLKKRLQLSYRKKAKYSYKRYKANYLAQLEINLE